MIYQLKWEVLFPVPMIHNGNMFYAQIVKENLKTKCIWNIITISKEFTLIAKQAHCILVKNVGVYGTDVGSHRRIS